MPRLAFLSTDHLEDFFVYDELTVPFFNAQGCTVETVSWHAQNQDWSKYDAVIVRSTWDYQQAADAFLGCLEEIDASGTQLLNPLALMRWNLHKTYLKDLQAKGVPVVSTTWSEAFSFSEAKQQFAHHQCDEIIIKPVLSANADDTFRLTPEQLNSQAEHLAACLGSRPIMMQPFLTSVVEEGEYSLFYFGGEYSHAICKRPKQGDFRVQEEHGGQLSCFNPSAELFELAEKTLAAMPTPALYARVDIIATPDGWAIMELELIEPSLYFNLDEKSPQRFVAATLQSLK